MAVAKNKPAAPSAPRRAPSRVPGEPDEFHAISGDDELKA